MYYAYASDPQMKLNLGIRRRLAPLLDNDRRRIELLNCLLLTLPGSPIVYYGDEIGMGDNVHLGDRNGVRTPMQWSRDRNAGFSTAEPGQLYLPVITDPVYGYQAVNVAAQDEAAVVAAQHDAAAHRRAPALAGVRARHDRVPAPAQPVGARLPAPLAGRHAADRRQPLRALPAGRAGPGRAGGAVPVEMLGDTRFPPIRREPYFLSPRPARLLLVPARGPPAPSRPLWHRRHRHLMGAAVPPARSPSGSPGSGGSAARAGASSASPSRTASGSGRARCWLVRVALDDGSTRTLRGAAARGRRGRRRARRPGRSATRCSALIARRRRGRPARRGELRGGADPRVSAGLAAGAAVRRLGGEQSNTSVVFGDDADPQALPPARRRASTPTSRSRASSPSAPISATRRACAAASSTATRPARGRWRSRRSW